MALARRLPGPCAELLRLRRWSPAGRSSGDGGRCGARPGCACQQHQRRLGTAAVSPGFPSAAAPPNPPFRRSGRPQGLRCGSARASAAAGEAAAPTPAPAAAAPQKHARKYRRRYSKHVRRRPPGWGVVRDASWDHARCGPRLSLVRAVGSLPGWAEISGRHIRWFSAAPCPRSRDWDLCDPCGDGREGVTDPDYWEAGASGWSVGEPSLDAPPRKRPRSNGRDFHEFFPSSCELLEMAERNDIVRGICGRTDQSGIFLARVPADIPDIALQADELLEVARSLRQDAEVSAEAAREALLKAIDFGFSITATRIYSRIWTSGFDAALSVEEHYAAFRFAPYLGFDRLTVRKILEPMSAKNAALAWDCCRSFGKRMSMEDHQYRIRVLSYGKDVMGTQGAMFDMKSDGWMPNLETYRLLARAYATSIDPLQTLDVLKLIRDANLVPDQPIYREIVRMHCALGDGEGAKRLLDSMLSTNRVIELMKEGKTAAGREELDLLHRRLPPSAGVAPPDRRPLKWDAELASVVSKFSPVKGACLPPAEAVTFTPLLSWLSAGRPGGGGGGGGWGGGGGGDWGGGARALEAVGELHAQMRAAKLPLDFRSYAVLIKSLIVCGDVAAAIGVWEDFRAEFGRCAVLPYHLYTTATSALLQARSAVAVEVAEAMIRLREQECGLPPFNSELRWLGIRDPAEPAAAADDDEDASWTVQLCGDELAEMESK